MENLIIPGQVQSDYQAGKISEEVYQMLCLIFAKFLEEEFTVSDLLEQGTVNEVKTNELLDQIVETGYITKVNSAQQIYQVKEFYQEGVKLALAQMEE
ncbi:hypothetical protein Halha_1196 [Halobacteroides halobius DSM 5150]|uniref:Uncharacterized protein n=1 Tax=Halobacteroides halobius (strain ATCC 35273 / DSM 5150 / MD-1) TaxID=748449 RepID=L0K9U0_HALHC|nr:hypothetical protein [Halobacteroides halobius]AGB41144.1 hypothetical protein Halha_1196 [Halobacteroides halobius DSM 5150]